MKEDIKDFTIHKMKPSSMRWMIMLEEKMDRHLSRLKSGEMNYDAFRKALIGECASFGLSGSSSGELMKAYMGKTAATDNNVELFNFLTYLENFENGLDQFMSRRKNPDNGAEIEGRNNK